MFAPGAPDGPVPYTHVFRETEPVPPEPSLDDIRAQIEGEAMSGVEQAPTMEILTPAEAKARGMPEVFAEEPEPADAGLPSPYPVLDDLPEGVKYARIVQEPANTRIKFAEMLQGGTRITVWVSIRDNEQARGRMSGKIVKVVPNIDPDQGGYRIWRPV